MDNYVTFVSRQKLHDLNPLGIGFAKCVPDFNVGPVVLFDYAIIHYVIKGKGVFKKNGKSYSVYPGQSFIIMPNEEVQYTADTDDPWTYQWINFDGELMWDFAVLPPVFPGNADFFSELYLILSKKGDDKNLRLFSTSALFKYYAGIKLHDDENTFSNLVYDAKKYIDNNYMFDLSVEALAKRYRISRFHFTRLFSREFGKSPYEYLTAVRMNAARAHMLAGRSVTETAGLCGYNDSSNFTKAFKANNGVGPREFIKINRK